MKIPVTFIAAYQAIPVVCVTAAFRPSIENIHSASPQSVQPPAPAVPAPPASAPEPSAAPEPAAPPTRAGAPVPGGDPITMEDVSVIPTMRVDPHVVIPPMAPIVSIDDASTINVSGKPEVHVSPN